MSITRSPYVNSTSKGKSFNFSEWNNLDAYNNNSFIQDFVTYNGALYACINSVPGGMDNPRTDTADGNIQGRYWIQVVKGIPGKQGNPGINGVDGKTYVPVVSSAGTLTWTTNEGNPPQQVNIKGPKGDAGNSLEFLWKNSKLLVRQVGSTEWTESPDLQYGKVYVPELKNGNLTFSLKDKGLISSEINLGNLKGKDGKDGKDGKNGNDGGNVILRVDTDPALFPDENYCGTHIQWKYDTEDYSKWRNLVQINQLMNLALGGINLEYLGEETRDNKKVAHLVLNYYEVDYIDTNGKIVFGNKIRKISDVYIPASTDGGKMEWEQYDPDDATSTTNYSLRVICTDPIAGAVVKLNNIETNEIIVPNGTSVNVSVSAPCYKTESHIITVSSDIFEEVNLIKE